MRVPKTAVRLDAPRRLWVVVECPYCGRRNHHRHGAGGFGDEPEEFLGNRAADCGGNAGTYDIVDDGVPFDDSRVNLRQPKLAAAAAKASGLSIRTWNREYRGRVRPLTEDELRARGDDDFETASGW